MAAVSTYRSRVAILVLLTAILVALGVDSLAGWPISLPSATPLIAVLIGLGVIAASVGAYRLSRTRTQRAISLGTLAVLISGICFLILMADHAGFAVPIAQAPRDDGLPGRITYANRHYRSLGESCWSKDLLTSHGYWPLTQVAAIPTLFGALHPIMAPGSGADEPELPATPTVVFVPAEAGCYLTYGLEGGP
ncbi:hypothetical protein [Nitrolancea hollandica]|uniref:Uncharacterized protein n=1 Tax=Nitrolancea hollandica Lb TaxID=1129897 RepID=I4EK60_9BACT|nr:hypothetical protein [Nitrolancea hollandica]CCF85072.1 membrane hypothetical protein [Nitrolancea hollandica Lb]